MAKGTSNAHSPRQVVVFGVVIAIGLLTLTFFPKGKEESARDNEGPQAPVTKKIEQTPPLSSSSNDNSTPVVSGPLEQAAAWKREALTTARDVADAYPEEAISYALLGSAYFNVGQSQEAVENLQHCISWTRDKEKPTRFLHEWPMTKVILKKPFACASKG